MECLQGDGAPPCGPNATAVQHHMARFCSTVLFTYDTMPSHRIASNCMQLKLSAILNTSDPVLKFASLVPNAITLLTHTSSFRLVAPRPHPCGFPYRGARHSHDFMRVTPGPYDRRVWLPTFATFASDQECCHGQASVTDNETAGLLAALYACLPSWKAPAWCVINH